MSFADIDEQVVRRHEMLRDLMDQFVCVRLTRAERLDLSLFQFDPDLSFAVFFINADKTIYGRYSSRSDFYEADRDVSLEGLRKAMKLALTWHDRREEIEELFANKRGPEPRYPTLADFPSPRKGRGYSRSLEGSSDRCKHCHDIRTAQQLAYRAADEQMPDDVLFSWPMPDVAGMHLDPKEVATIQSVTEGSAADDAGMQIGDEIVSMEGQPVLSIADVQWVLQNADNEDTLAAEIRRGGKKLTTELVLDAGWRRAADISWRMSTSELRRTVLAGVSYRTVPPEDRAELGIPSNGMALRAARGVSRSTGLIRRGDVVVAVDDRDNLRTEGDLIAYFVQEKKQGDDVKFTLLRAGKTLEVDVPVKN